MNRLYTTFCLLLAVFGLSSGTLAQHELTINCYPHYTPLNGVWLDSNVVEYNTCSVNSSPAFYVVVFDPATCVAWGSEYNGVNEDHDFGNFNSNGACRWRSENYFIFLHTDTNQLLGMNNMIMNEIPTGFPYAIYTPFSYNYAAINGVCPALTQTLSTKWDPAVIQDDHIMVLFGIQGQASTFLEDTVTNDNHVSFTTTICDVTGLGEMNAHTPTVYYAGEDQFEVNTNEKMEVISLHSLTGEVIPSVVSGNTLTAQQTLPAGIYFIRGTLAGKEWAQKVFVY
ncbi:MAG: hypothetical protein V4604_07980 [Bacteroidota bacterium]